MNIKKPPHSPPISWCSGELLSTIRLELGMVREKLSATFTFLLILEGCWMSRWAAGRSQVIAWNPPFVLL